MYSGNPSAVLRSNPNKAKLYSDSKPNMERWLLSVDDYSDYIRSHNGLKEGEDDASCPVVRQMEAQ
jgi:hypothetical protein